MNWEVKWPDPSQDKHEFWSKAPPPFDNIQKGRPIRITFHKSSFVNLSTDEGFALKMLYEIAEAGGPNISALTTEPGTNIYHLAIGLEVTNNYLPVTIKYSDNEYLESGVMFPDKFSEIAMQIINSSESDSNENDYKEVFNDLIVANAHCSVKQDILITSSKWLLGNRKNRFIEEANPHSPSEALKIIGLLLRIRNDFRYAGNFAFDKGLYYWVLTRQKLPTMWKYFSACVYSEEIRKDNISILGQSILTRSCRAIQARDHIGKQFYLYQNNNSRDETMYHFDYFMLLISGAIDAQARVANRTYEIYSTEKERNASFRNKEYTTKLEKSAPRLANFISSEYFQDISLLISKMRNSIHGAGLLPIAYKKEFESEVSLIRIPDSDRQTVLDICSKYTSPTEWGLIIWPDAIFTNPFLFTENILEHTFNIINNIADATEVEKLFPFGTDLSKIDQAPPLDQHPFQPEILKRLSYLF